LLPVATCTHHTLFATNSSPGAHGHFCPAGTGRTYHVKARQPPTKVRKSTPLRNLRMQHAQFRMIPPLIKVKELFVEATGQTFHVGATWTVWVSPVNSALYETFRPYIRPSHNALLNSVITAGPSAHPTAFLRQLLRPHGYKIETTSTGWILREKAEADSPVVKVHTSSVKIDWS